MTLSGTRSLNGLLTMKPQLGQSLHKGAPMIPFLAAFFSPLIERTRSKLDDRGAMSVELIILIVGLVLLAIVVVAWITGYANQQMAQLPG